MSDNIKDGMYRAQFMIPVDLKKKFKLKCVENGSSMTKVVTDFIAAYTGPQQPQDGQDAQT